MRSGRTLSDLVLCSTGVLQRTVPSPFLITLHTSNVQYNSGSGHLQKYSDNSAVIGCVIDVQEEENRARVHLTYPKMFPGRDLTVEGISWASSAHHLSVTLQGEGRCESPTTYSAGCQPISHQLHGVLRGQTAAVVADERNAIADGVVSECVGSLPEPPSTLVDVPIRACDKALSGQRLSDSVSQVKRSHVKTLYLYPMSSQPLSS